MGFSFEKLFLEKRKNFNQFSAERDQKIGKPEGIREYDDVLYAEDGNSMHRMDIFQPLECAEQKLPVLIDIHGGGMIMGHKEFNRHFCADICKRGYLVFSIEYSYVPEVQVYDQFQDIFLAMDHIAELIPQYGGDIERVYMAGDSSGAYHAMYVTAMQNCPEIAKAANVTPSTLKVRALGLISGMFYTTKLDEIGLFMPKFLYGKHYKKSAFAPYVNPTHERIVTSLPPSFLVTGNNDHLKHYTLNFEKALTKHGMEHELLFFEQDNKELAHAFCVFKPYIEESQELVEKMLNFFQKC